MLSALEAFKTYLQQDITYTLPTFLEH